MSPIRSIALAVALVPAAAGYLVDVRATPTIAGARLRVAVKEAARNATVRRFALLHDQPMHLFVVGEGLEFFVHEHPAAQPDGVFMADLALPRPGPYMAIVEFQPDGGPPQMLHHAFTTGAAFPRAVRPPLDPAPKIVDGMRVSLDASTVKAGAWTPLSVQIQDLASGAPVADLEPFDGAVAHLVAVSADMTEAVHEHAPAATRGSNVVFRVLLPRAGLFKVWIQFQRGGKITTAGFVIEGD